MRDKNGGASHVLFSPFSRNFCSGKCTFVPEVTSHQGEIVIVDFLSSFLTAGAAEEQRRNRVALLSSSGVQQTSVFCTGQDHRQATAGAAEEPGVAISSSGVQQTSVFCTGGCVTNWSFVRTSALID